MGTQRTYHIAGNWPGLWNGIAVSTWPDHDAASADIAQGLRRSAGAWRASRR